MVAVTKADYAPSTEYVENAMDSLVDFKMTDSTELWLMQFPINLDIDAFNNQEVSLHLHHEGNLGTVEGSSGKAYDLVSYASQEPDATVFASCSSESKIVGRISRLVSVVDYPEPSELMDKQKKKALSFSMSSASSMKSPRNLTTPSQSIQRMSMSKSAASTHSSKQKSALSEELAEPSKSLKRHKIQGEGSSHIANGITSSGSVGSTHQKKSKSKTKN